MRIVFLGTPAFAVPTLEALAREPGWAVTGVICQPDRPAGRGQKPQAPAVKLAAEGLGIAVHQPERIRQPEALAWLAAQAPEVLAVVAYGQLLPRAVFEMGRWGAINAHASLLPAYRGAAPIQWAIANGETTTGVTTMRINAGLDTGDMLLQRAVPIPPAATAPELSQALAAVAAALMVETFRGLEQGGLTPQPQPAAGTLAPLLTRADGRADWSRPAPALYHRWRGFQPWPGLYTVWRGQTLAIVRCRCAAAGTAEEAVGVAAGRLLARGGGLVARCGQGALVLDEVRLEGRRTVTGAAFAAGARLPEAGDALDRIPGAQ